MKRIFLSLLAAFALGGCSANWNAIHYREADARVTPTIAVDAKQRFLISNVRPPTPEKAGADHHAHRHGHARGAQVLCAEPSPDALSVISSSLSGSGALDRAFGGGKEFSAALSLAMSRSESGAFVGLRTQTIQLLRDGMYRLCEAYASGALDEDEYRKSQQRYQTITLALLSIEQLTGALASRPAALGTTASAGTADAFVTLQEKLAEAVHAAAAADAAKAKATAAAAKTKEALDAADAKLKACTAPCATQAALQTELTNATTANAKATGEAEDATAAAKIAHDTVDGLEAAVNRAKATLLKTATGATAQVSSDPPAAGNQEVMGSDKADVIATRVRQIAFGALLATHALEQCFDPKSWLALAKNDLALNRMDLLCRSSVGALATGSINEAGTGDVAGVALGTEKSSSTAGSTSSTSSNGQRDTPQKTAPATRSPIIRPQGLIEQLWKK